MALDFILFYQVATILLHAVRLSSSWRRDWGTKGIVVDRFSHNRLSRPQLTCRFVSEFMATAAINMYRRRSQVPLFWGVEHEFGYRLRIPHFPSNRLFNTATHRSESDCDNGLPVVPVLWIVRSDRKTCFAARYRGRDWTSRTVFNVM